MSSLRQQPQEEILTSTPNGRNTLFNKIQQEVNLLINKEEKAENLQLKQNSAACLSAGHINAAIEALHLEKDQAYGIHSYYVTFTETPPAQNQRVLVRDASAQQQKKHQETYHSWAIMGLNYFNAAKKLVAGHDKTLSDAQVKYLQQSAQVFFKTITYSKDPEIEMARMINAVIVPFLVDRLDISSAKVNKQLGEVRDFCNFDTDTLSVATITSIPRIESGDKIKVLQIDVPMCGNMDDELRLQYESLKDFAAGKTSKQDLEKIVWFTNQPSYIKPLIILHAKDILLGKIIPTQLRKYCPGIRNAGEERLIVLDQDENLSKVIYAGYHAGNPGHLLGNKAINQRATDQSVAQLQRLIGAKKLNIQTLLSPVNRGFSDDANLATQVSNAAREMRSPEKEIYHSNTPFNTWRKFDFDGAIKIINVLFRTDLQSNFKITGADALYETAKNIGQGPADDKTYAALQTVLKEYKKLRAGSAISDPENTNLSLVSTLKLMAGLVNQIKNELVMAEIDPCQSGKDRQGLARMKAINDALMLHITGEIAVGNNQKLKEQEETIRHCMTQSGQVRKQAGLQGGTLGAEGVKTDTKGAVPESWQADKDFSPVIEKTASYNKEPPATSKRWYKNPKFWLAAFGLLLGVGLCATGIGAAAGIPLLAVIGGTGLLSANLAVGTLTIAGSIASLFSAKKMNALAQRQLTLGGNNYHYRGEGHRLDAGSNEATDVSTSQKSSRSSSATAEMLLDANARSRRASVSLEDGADVAVDEQPVAGLDAPEQKMLLHDGEDKDSQSSLHHRGKI